MKYPSFFLFCTVLLSLSFAPHPFAVHTIEEAIQKGLVEVAITGADTNMEDTLSDDFTSVYFGKSIVLSIQNKSGNHLRLKLENGRVFSAQDEAVQDMVVTHGELITLHRGRTQEHEIYAMCAEMTDQAPSASNSFTLGTMAVEDVQGMTALVEKYKVQNSSGQDAVWAITDDIPVSNLYFDDPRAEKEIKEYAYAVTGQQKESMPENEALYEEEAAPLEVREISGTFSFTIESKSMVTLVLYGPSGEVAQEIYKGQPLDRAEYDIDFSAGSAHLQPGTYVMKLWVDRELAKTMEFVVE